MHLSAEQWERGFEDSPIPLALVTPDHRFAQCNRAFCELLGYTEDQLTRRKWTSVTHPDDIEGDMAGAEQIAREPDRQSYVIDKRYITQRGFIVSVRLGVCGIREDGDDGKFVGYFVSAIHQPDQHVTRDVSEQRTPGVWKWARDNPKDAIIVGLSAFILLGRETILELLKAYLSGDK